MPDRDPLNSPALQSRALIWLVAIVTVLFAMVLWPLSGAVSWAVFIAIVFAPLQERSVLVCRGRRGWAAFATLLVIVVSVMLPTALLVASVTQEAAAFYERFKSGDISLSEYFQRGIDVLPGWVRSGLDRLGLADLGLVQQKLVDALGHSGQALTSRAFTIGQNTLEFLVSWFVMLYLLFFLLRDGKSLSAHAARALPLKEKHTQRLLAQFATVVRATVKGNVVVALVQGTLGGLAFWALDISGALLWGALMALLSLLPAVGAALVWGPVAIYLLATGSILQALGLTAWGVLVIGLVDNVLRPIMVGKETRLPDYLVLIATLGGLAVFGVNGFVIGPVIAAVFLAAWDIFSEVRREQAATARERPPGRSR
ncbi:MAG TPA: AI-2E family transporter [Ramlibacter sp.]|nr:AI-2E family transporter [Ramlibacter sp.]